MRVMATSFSRQSSLKRARDGAERDVARALHAAPLLHSCLRGWDMRFEFTVEKFSSGADGFDHDLQAGFEDAMNRLWDSTRARGTPDEFYRIPAFLRRQAD